MNAAKAYLVLCVVLTVACAVGEEVTLNLVGGVKITFDATSSTTAKEGGVSKTVYTLADGTTVTVTETGSDTQVQVKDKDGKPMSLDNFRSKYGKTKQVSARNIATIEAEINRIEAEIEASGTVTPAQQMALTALHNELNKAINDFRSGVSYFNVRDALRASELNP